MAAMSHRSSLQRPDDTEDIITPLFLTEDQKKKKNLEQSNDDKFISALEHDIIQLIMKSNQFYIDKKLIQELSEKMKAESIHKQLELLHFILHLKKISSERDNDDLLRKLIEAISTFIEKKLLELISFIRNEFRLSEPTPLILSINIPSIGGTDITKEIIIDANSLIDKVRNDMINKLENNNPEFIRNLRENLEQILNLNCREMINEHFIECIEAALSSNDPIYQDKVENSINDAVNDLMQQIKGKLNENNVYSSIDNQAVALEKQQKNLDDTNKKVSEKAAIIDNTSNQDETLIDQTKLQSSVKNEDLEIKRMTSLLEALEHKNAQPANDRKYNASATEVDLHDKKENLLDEDDSSTFQP